MSLQRVQLRKLLRLFYSNPADRRRIIKDDIRAERAKEAGEAGDGGDFYAGFWADAKGHVVGNVDIAQAVALRIEGNQGRANLYPQLRDGFLHWWGEQRRQTNAPFHSGRNWKGTVDFPELSGVVKIDNMLAFKDGSDREYAIYPYFSPAPILSNEAAALGLWAIAEAVDDLPSESVQILDVMRGASYSLSEVPLFGNVQDLFLDLYRGVLDERDRFLREMGS